MTSDGEFELRVFCHTLLGADTVTRVLHYLTSLWSTFTCTCRCLSLVLEHNKGDFPLWLSPRQVAVVPVAVNALERAREVALMLK